MTAPPAKLYATVPHLASASSSLSLSPFCPAFKSVYVQATRAECGDLYKLNFLLSGDVGRVSEKGKDSVPREKYREVGTDDLA
jgi:hypothetical protein